MISVLIPVYNFDVQMLVKGLLEQLERLCDKFEIMIIDDCSETSYKIQNRLIGGLNHVIYEELDSNIGRSKIRNLLASKAQYAHLLFLDCDSSIQHNPDFISNYLKHLQNAEVLYGGTIYNAVKPNAQFVLHWHYGAKIESPRAEIRNKDRFKSFKSNNFLSSKKVFDILKFDETINNYGYEDNLLAEALKDKGMQILHLDNEVMHLGLNENAVFLDKTNTAIKTLVALHKANKIIPTKLLQTYSAINNAGLGSVLRLCAKIFTPLTRRLILEFPSNMMLFQIWKLFTISIEMKKPA